MLLAASRADCALQLNSARSALARDEFLPASARLHFRERAYHLASQRPCASAVGVSFAARYDVYRTTTSLGEYCSLACGNLLRAATDLARDARCGHCSVEGIRNAEGLRALPTHPCQSGTGRSSFLGVPGHG